MSDDVITVGTIRKLADGRHEGRMTRVYEGHGPGEIWAMLTEPAHIAQWIAPGHIELKVGGEVRIDFEDSGSAIHSTVQELEPGRLLAYSWSQGKDPQRPLRWEVDEVDGNGRLSLTAIIPAGEDVAKACAGFDAHMEMLAGALEGVPMKFPYQMYVAARNAYNAEVAKA